MAFKDVQNSGNWLAGQTYTYYVKAVWQCGAGTCCYPIHQEFQAIENGILGHLYGRRLTDNMLTAFVGQGFLFSEATYLADFAVSDFELILYKGETEGPYWNFKDKTVSGPVITKVEVLDAANHIIDPWNGHNIVWTDAYLFGVWLKVTVSIPADLPDGFYYLLSLFSKWSKHHSLAYYYTWSYNYPAYTDYWGFHPAYTVSGATPVYNEKAINQTVLPYLICVGEDYWPGGSMNPTPEPNTPEGETDITYSTFTTESMTVSVSPLAVPGGGGGGIIPPDTTYEYNDVDGLTHKIRIAACKMKLNMRHKVSGKEL